MSEAQGRVERDEQDRRDGVTTRVHLVRHGEVHNPEGVLYGRMEGFGLSERGRAMAERVADALGGRDVRHLVCSPLQRTRETAAPLADRRGLEVVPDPRVLESLSHLQGRRLVGGRGVLRDPRAWRYLWNPFRPSWGEPYRDVLARMLPAVDDARRAAEGGEAVVVSHQLPIWATRLHLTGRRLLHDPRRRQCTPCSVTTLVYAGERLLRVDYSEPAGDLLAVHDRHAPFSAGGA